MKMTYDPNNPNDPNRTTTPNPDLDLRTTPVEHTRSSAWVGWAAAIAAIAVIAVAYTLWSGTPDTDPQPTASTTNSEPTPDPAKPMAPADNNATPAPATPPASPAQQ
jgi:type IV secretory pathway VirB10-like protein